MTPDPTVNGRGFLFSMPRIASTLPTLLLLWLCLYARGPAAPQTDAASRGDAFLSSMEYERALEAYMEGAHASSADAELLWRIARVYVLRSETALPEAAAAMLDSAESYGRRAVAADSLRAEGYTWLAGALGYKALTAGVSERIILSVELIRHLDRAETLNPQNDVACSIRGSFYRALGNVGWVQRSLAELLFGDIPEGGFEEGEKALQKAIRIAPDVMRHQYELGVLYLDMGRMEEARVVLERAARLPVRIASDRPRRLKIGELLYQHFAVSPAPGPAAGAEANGR